MEIIRPVNIWESQIVSSTVAEPATGTNPDPALWSNSSLYILGDQVYSASTKKKYQSRVGKSSLVTISNSTPAIVSWMAHNLSEGTPVIFDTTGALPTGLTAGTTYYVKSPTTDSFNVSASVGGAAIATSSAGSGVHTARASRNVGFDPTLTISSDYWLEVGAINKYAMFDDGISTKTSIAGELKVVIEPGEVVDNITLINVKGVKARVKIGTYYDQTKYLNTRTVTNAYEMVFEPFITETNIVFSDIPPSSSAQIEITITPGTGETAECGVCKVGRSREIGTTLYGTSFSIIDYSRKEPDEFGNIIFVERPYRRKLDVPIEVKNSFIGELDRILSEYRSTPLVALGVDFYSPLISYGFIKGYDVTINNFSTSKCQLQFEGLV